MLWQFTASKIEGHGNSKVHTKGSSVGELKLRTIICFSEASHLLSILKEMRVQFDFLLQYRAGISTKKNIDVCMQVCLSSILWRSEI